MSQGPPTLNVCFASGGPCCYQGSPPFSEVNSYTMYWSTNMIMVHTAETKHRPAQAHCFAFSIVLSLLPRRIGIQPCSTSFIPTTLKEKHGLSHSFFTKSTTRLYYSLRQETILFMANLTFKAPGDSRGLFLLMYPTVQLIYQLMHCVNRLMYRLFFWKCHEVCDGSLIGMRIYQKFIWKKPSYDRNLLHFQNICRSWSCEYNILDFANIVIDPFQESLIIGQSIKEVALMRDDIAIKIAVWAISIWIFCHL